MSSEQKICPTCGTEYPLSERFCPRDGTALRSSNQQADLLGSIVADRYHIIKKLGEGGMGTVYLAEHVKMGRKSALKVMNPGMNTDADAIARFNREASNASRLSHPNICGIYDFGETSDGLIYLAMEFIEGSSLTSLIEKTGAMPAARCGSIIHQTADALQVAHDAGIVHRDLKPDNIMVTKNRDGSDLVKVVDFGIAKASSSDAQKVTKTGLVVGTPEYMSPEQLAGDKLDGRSDIYSLGLVAFNCLTGKLPFPAETVQEAMIMRLTDRPRTLAETSPGIAWPAELQRTLDQALQRDAEERYASAAQFGREFSAAISAMPATQAMEAGTMVMGAAAPAGREVPPTRVDRPSVGAKTQAMPVAPVERAGAARAAVAEKPKSRMPMMAGGGTLLVAAAAAVIWMKGQDPVPTGNGTTTPPTVANAADSTKDTTAGAVPYSGDAPAKVPDVAPQVTTPVTRPVTKTDSKSAVPVAAPDSSAAATGDDANPQRVGGVLGRMAIQAVGTTATAQQLNQLSLRAQNIRKNPRLSLDDGQIADTYYVEMMAEARLAEEFGRPARRPPACVAAGQVARTHPNEERKAAAVGMRSSLECDP